VNLRAGRRLTRTRPNIRHARAGGCSPRKQECPPTRPARVARLCCRPKRAAGSAQAAWLLLERSSHDVGSHDRSYHDCCRTIGASRPIALTDRTWRSSRGCSFAYATDCWLSGAADSCSETAAEACPRGRVAGAFWSSSGRIGIAPAACRPSCAGAASDRSRCVPI
jgi:hypothetical protein